MSIHVTNITLSARLGICNNTKTGIKALVTLHKFIFQMRFSVLFLFVSRETCDSNILYISEWCISHIIVWKPSSVPGFSLYLYFLQQILLTRSKSKQNYEVGDEKSQLVDKKTRGSLLDYRVSTMLNNSCIQTESVSF